MFPNINKNRITGGIGLAPLRPVIYEVLHARNDFEQVTLLYGARTPYGLLYTDEFARWRDAGIDVQVTVDRGSPGWKGNVGVVGCGCR